MTQSVKHLDAKQRYAADAMMAVIRKAIAAMIAGNRDPADPYTWDNYSAFQLYMELQSALDAAHLVRLGQPTYFAPDCSTCLHFKHYASDRADEKPIDLLDATDGRQSLLKEEADALTVGICTANPPSRGGFVRGVGDTATSYFVRVHREMTCGQWAAITRRGRL